MRILFVCLGNICRSPAAEGVLRARAARSERALKAASAGVGGWHQGAPPDPRMIAACAARGYDISGQRARKLHRDDLSRFDWVIAMDADNLAAIETLGGGGTARRALLLSFAKEAPRDVPDPYYGSGADFERALDLIERGVDGFLAALDQRMPSR